MEFTVKDYLDFDTPCLKETDRPKCCRPSPARGISRVKVPTGNLQENRACVSPEDLQVRYLDYLGVGEY